MLHALDVVIGLAAVYTAFSLLASWINETFNSITSLRARTLKNGIEQMVGDATLHAQLYGQPSIQAARGKNARDPSYLSGKQFSLAVMNLINAASAIGATGPAAIAAINNGVATLPASRLKGTLTAVLAQSTDKVDTFVAGVETWFDDEMDRVSGWYKRNTQIWLIVIGVILAVLFNVDTVRFASNFVSNPLVLDNCNLQGDQTKAEQCVSTNVFSQINVGWYTTANCPPSASGQPAKDPCWDVPNGWGWLLKIVGILLSAIAVSLGAPFWFDTLSRFVNVRNSGPQPAKSTDPPTK